MSVGEDAWVVVGLIQDFRLDDGLPGDCVDRGFGAAAPPADPLIDQGR